MSQKKIYLIASGLTGVVGGLCISFFYIKMKKLEEKIKKQEAITDGLLIRENELISNVVKHRKQLEILKEHSKINEEASCVLNIIDTEETKIKQELADLSLKIFNDEIELLYNKYGITRVQTDDKIKLEKLTKNWFNYKESEKRYGDANKNEFIKQQYIKFRWNEEKQS